MKLIGLIGGMSWENTIEYYRMINDIVNKRLGNWNSSTLLLYSVNFEEIYVLQTQKEWKRLASEMIKMARILENAGCEGLLICSNTMHKVADALKNQISIPIIHVVDETGKIIKESNIKTVGLFGTKFTMEETFYIKRLEEKYDLRVLIPKKKQRDFIHNVIYNELAQGIIKKNSKIVLLKIVNDLKNQGIQGLILGCTELPMIIKKKDVDIPLFDTLIIHMEAAAEFALR